MAGSVATPVGEPMVDMNMTPLIDVLLVLLIIFILNVPAQTHAVKLDLPQNNSTPPTVDPIKNKITIDPDNTIRWNGAPVTLVVLRQYLDATQQLNPVPELHLQPDPQARYDVVDHVMAVTKGAKVEKMGFVGNEAYSSF